MISNSINKEALSAVKGLYLRGPLWRAGKLGMCLSPAPRPWNAHLSMHSTPLRGTEDATLNPVVKLIELVIKEPRGQKPKTNKNPSSVLSIYTLKKKKKSHDTLRITEVQ